MAIDTKELRIGSHINVRGKRVEIESITNDSQIGYYLPNYDDWRASDPCEDWVEPIPITPELLTELGFELNEDWNKCLRGSKRLEKLDGFIQFKKLDSEFDNLWEMIVGVENGRYQLTQCLFVHYIHEAESFLYLATKQELIND